MVGERKEETECIGGAKEKETPEFYGELAQCRACADQTPTQSGTRTQALVTSGCIHCSFKMVQLD